MLRELLKHYSKIISSIVNKKNKFNCYKISLKKENFVGFAKKNVQKLFHYTLSYFLLFNGIESLALTQIF